MVVATEAEAEAVKKLLLGISCEVMEDDGTYVIYVVSSFETELPLPQKWMHTRWREVENRGFRCIVYKFSE